MGSKGDGYGPAQSRPATLYQPDSSGITVAGSERRPLIERQLGGGVSLPRVGGVQVERRSSHIGVAENVAHHFEVCSGAQHPRGRRVSDCVEARVLTGTVETAVLEDTAYGSSHVRGAHGPARPGGKDEVVITRPRGLRSPFGKPLEHPGRHEDGALLMALRAPLHVRLARDSERQWGTYDSPHRTPWTARRLLSDVAVRYPAVTLKAECPRISRRLSRSPPPRSTSVAKVPRSRWSL